MAIDDRKFLQSSRTRDSNPQSPPQQLSDHSLHSLGLPFQMYTKHNRLRTRLVQLALLKVARHQRPDSSSSFRCTCRVAKRMLPPHIIRSFQPSERGFYPPSPSTRSLATTAVPRCLEELPPWNEFSYTGTAAQSLQGLANSARWRASVPSWAWPQDCTCVLSNRFAFVYEWQLRFCSRSVPPSIATRWVINTYTNKLARYRASPETAVGRTFLQLPREIRDSIYDYALLDERQMTSQSHIYTHSLLSRRAHHEKGWLWHCNLPTPTLGPLPTLHTPSILRACKQVRHEALEAVYRTKTLVITVNSIKDKLCDLNQSWLPSVSPFLHIRVDFVLACVAADTISECMRCLASMLLDQALSLQFLEIRIGYSHAHVSAAVHDHGFALVISHDDVARSMRELVPLIQGQEKRKGGRFKPLQITWGVSEAQKEEEDYSCACTYLSASFLQQIWTRICGGPKNDGDDVGLVLSEEDCRHLGCRFHRN